jgi:L-asparagine transporter-like permease
MVMDKLLIGYFQKVSENIYSWIGVSNFTLARIFLFLYFGTINSHSFLVNSRLDKYPDFLFILVSILIWSCWVLWEIRKTEKESTKDGFLNPLIFSWQFLRLFYLFFSLYALFFAKDSNMEYFLQISYSFSIVLTVYFGSCQQGPKKKSKLEKGIDKLKDLARSFVPSPSPTLAPVRS